MPDPEIEQKVKQIIVDELGVLGLLGGGEDEGGVGGGVLRTVLGDRIVLTASLFQRPAVPQPDQHIVRRQAEGGLVEFYRLVEMLQRSPLLRLVA